MTSELSLRLFVEWGIISEGEYLERMHPNPEYMYEECIEWEPYFAGDGNENQRKD